MRFEFKGQVSASLCWTGGHFVAQSPTHSHLLMLEVSTLHAIVRLADPFVSMFVLQFRF